MAGIHEFSEKVIDYATRLSDVADAAQGRRRSGGGLVRWTVLPASGAALFALVRSDFFARQAKEVVSEAKTLASDLPDDLMGLVRQTARQSTEPRLADPRFCARFDDVRPYPRRSAEVESVEERVVRSSLTAATERKARRALGYRSERRVASLWDRFPDRAGQLISRALDGLSKAGAHRTDVRRPRSSEVTGQWAARPDDRASRACTRSRRTSAGENGTSPGGLDR